MEKRPTRGGRSDVLVVEQPTTVLSGARSAQPDLLKQKSVALTHGDTDLISRIQTDFLRACLPLFFAETNPVRSLGLTSAIAGEGKTLVALLICQAVAAQAQRPVVLVECDWERPSLSRDLDLLTKPGLADWLRGSCDVTAIRHEVLPNLTVIPAGKGGPDAVAALAELDRSVLRESLAMPGQILIVDLPSVLGSYYGGIAARVVEALLLVVRAGSTPATLVTRASEELKGLRVEGVILNQVTTDVPQWLQSLL